MRDVPHAVGKGCSVVRCAIGFDFDHTLGVDNEVERHAFVEVALHEAARHGSCCDPSAAAAAFATHIQGYRNGRCSLPDAVGRAFEEVGIPASVDVVQAFRDVAVRLVPRFVEPVSGAQPLLLALHERRIPHAILTNGWNPLQRRKADHIGFKGAVFVSDDIGARKPNRRAFAILADHLGVPPACVWYVGDDPRTDVLGALGAGMRAVWFNPDGARFPTTIPAPTAVIENLAELLRLIAPATGMHSRSAASGPGMPDTSRMP
jgi:putative hydrolase of the HAD superfamily